MQLGTTPTGKNERPTSPHKNAFSLVVGVTRLGGGRCKFRSPEAEKGTELVSSTILGKCLASGYKGHGNTTHGTGNPALMSSQLK